MGHWEEILKYFPCDQNRSEVEEYIRKSLGIGLDFIFNPRKQPIVSEVTLPELEDIFSDVTIPEKANDFEQVLEEVKTNLASHLVRVSDPAFVGHMTGSVPFLGLMADVMISAFNQNVVKIETSMAASFLEKQTITWLHRMVYKQGTPFYQAHIQEPNSALGAATNGGTMGNFTALAVARNRALPSCWEKGLIAAIQESGHKGLAILVSSRGHYSLNKAAGLLGLGREQILKIPVESFSNRIDLKATEAMIKKCQREGILVVALVGVAGSTETGSIDDLESLSDLAAYYGIWFHVDAAWGGSLLLSKSQEDRMQGITKADSVTLDGHKFFYLPMAHGAVVFRDQTSLGYIHQTAQYIIRSGSVDIGQFSLEGSRRFDAFKLWFFLKVMGREGYEVLIDHMLSQTEKCYDCVRGREAFEITSELTTNIFTYRFVPPFIKACIPAIMQDSPEKLKQLWALLNKLNKTIQKTQRQRGQSFVSRTSLESVLPGAETTVFRVVLFNPQSSVKIFNAILDEQTDSGYSVLKEWEHDSQWALWLRQMISDTLRSYHDTSKSIAHRC